jgi:hypothetical protein
MRREAFGVLMMAGSLFAATPLSADAQLSVQVGLFWELGDDGWRAYRPEYVPAREVYYAPSRAVRVPPGHMPPPGKCRLWYPDRPPGHQPRPQPCEHLFRTYHHPGAVIIGSPDFRVAHWAEDEGRRGKRGRGRGHR